MATVNTWTWTIDNMHQWPSGNNAGYVVNVSWSLTGSDGTNSSSVKGRVHYPISDAAPGFTPYSQLTQDQVIGWVQNSLGSQQVNNYKNIIQQRINNIGVVPVVPVANTLPWAPKPPSANT